MNAPVITEADTPPVFASDPVLAAIKAHRRAYDAWEAGRAEATVAPDDQRDARLAVADALLADMAAEAGPPTDDDRQWARSALGLD